jgi:chlorite dismutase
VTAAALQAGLGRWLHVRRSFLGLLQPSPYVRRAPSREPSLFRGHRSRYLVVYPFTKAAGWYQFPLDARKAVMSEHIRAGRAHSGVRQLLANSFGVDDMDFLVAYETDDLADFSGLVRELRGTAARRWTEVDTPVLPCVHRPLQEITRLLGAA